MNIQDAIKNALEENKSICRKGIMLESESYESRQFCIVKPSHENMPCDIIDTEEVKHYEKYRYFDPTAEDLMADDWMLVE